ncbi:uncharacterized protein LOC127137643 [Lathyrus oleraceus]|uniref:uncharacterized protein LOC127137643 n=1 Tax=Pisum sativum TaxID=3888 RepID=UPI0021CEC9CC|nr:uncharacterized protein LOC127137643 [Pisum sativum]
MDMAPDRRQSQSMFQHDKESFKEYAQRWRELASQVEPPLAEKELAELFIDTVQPQFYEKMVGSTSLGFSELVAIGARVEYGLRNGKLAAVAGNSNANPKKFFGGFPRKKEGEANAVTIGQGRASLRRKPKQYSPEQYVQQPFPYQQPMYPVQYAPQPYIVVVTPAFNQQPPQAYQVPPVYRPTPVQQRAAVPPACQQAPAAPVYQQPRAQAPRQNAQNKNRRQGDRATFNQIPMSYTELYPSLLQKGLVVPRLMGPPPGRLPPWYNPNAHCPFHEGAPKHDLEGFYALKHRVCELIESKILSFKDMGPNLKINPLPPHGDPAVNAIEDASVVVTVDKVDDVRTPLACCKERRCAAVPANSQLSPAEICMPTPFPYESTKAVPWKYEITAVEKVVEGSANVEVTEARSNYKVVDQLHQTPSKISILSLLLNSQAHREALLKVLAQAHVTQSITVDQFAGVVANITACNTLSFSGEELPEAGQNHNRALYISVKCKDDALARVLVDTGSSLNVMPKRTLAKLSYLGPAMKHSALVMDINPAYSCLLGRPWIHAAGAVASTLH